MWYARPQLFFNCTLCPAGAKGDRGMHKEISLVYFTDNFSTFASEHIELSIMQRAGVPMLYYSACNLHLPCLYICLVANVLGCAPLIPCFISGNRYPTIPHRFKDNRRLEDSSANTQRDRGNGSRLYEGNIWMWRYGLGRSRMVSIAEAERMRSERLSESRLRAAEMRKCRSEAAAAAGAAEGGGRAG